jgi:hypothetical protein
VGGVLAAVVAVLTLICLVCWRRRDAEARRRKSLDAMDRARQRLREKLDRIDRVGSADRGQSYVAACRECWQEIDNFEAFLADARLGADAMNDANTLVKLARAVLRDDPVLALGIDRAKLPQYRQQDEKVAETLRSVFGGRVQGPGSPPRLESQTDSHGDTARRSA